MNARRRFFTNLLGAATVAASNTALAKPEVIEVPRQKIPDDFTHGDWKIHWSGWKEEVCSDNLIAQWTAKTGPDLGAFKNGFHGVFSATTGSVGEYHTGDVFNLCWMDGYTPITASTLPEVKDRSRERALKKLMAFILTDPLADRSKCYRCGGVSEMRDDPRYVHMLSISDIEGGFFSKRSIFSNGAEHSLSGK